MVGFFFNPSTWEAEAGGSFESSPAWSTEHAPGQLELHRETLPQNKQTNNRTQYTGLGQKTYLLNKLEELHGNWIKNFYLALLLERLSQRDSGFKACPRNLVRPYVNGLKAGVVAQIGRKVIENTCAPGFYSSTTIK